MSLSQLSDHRENQDWFQLLAIFPIEIWHIIFDQLTNPEDMQSVYNASRFFADLFYSKRGTFLFPQVFRILQNTVNQKYLPESKDNTDEAREAMVDKDCNKIFKLRLVSKLWNSAIESYYQNELHRNETTALPYGYNAVTYFGFNNIAKFLTHFEESHHTEENNPFWTRALEIHIYSSGNDFAEEFINQVYTALKKYGRHLHKCCFIFNTSLFLPQFYNKLQSFMTLLPNLKFLRICCWPTYMETRHFASLLTTCVESKPLPKFENLVRLETMWVPYAMANHLIKINNHVKDLQVLRNQHYSQFTLFSEPLLNLGHIKVDVYLYKDIKKLRNMPLGESLSSVELFIMNPAIPLLKLFTLFNDKLGHTLRHFILVFVQKETYNVPSVESKRRVKSDKIKNECNLLHKQFFSDVTKLEVKFFLASDLLEPLII